MGRGAGPLEVSQEPLPSGKASSHGEGRGAWGSAQAAGDGPGLSQATPRVWGPDSQAQFGKIWITPQNT